MEASLKTSRNQVSRNIQRLADKGETSVLVYGCGRFVNQIKDRVGMSTNWAWYEPNIEYLSTVPKGRFKNVILDNVVNVLKDSQLMQRVLEDAFSKVDLGGSLWVNIYEGNRSGVGEFTDSKCQRNEKISEYRFDMELLGGKLVEKITGGFRVRAWN